jgi:hypothetical protein
MNKTLVLVLGVVLCGATAFAAVKSDPGELSGEQLVKYFDKMRNLDRWLQQGNYGNVIKNGKEVLKDFVTEDAEAAYCVAAAYACVAPTDEEDTWEESLKHLEDSINWGFRNVDILKTTKFFDGIRTSKKFPEHAKKFQDMIAHLEKVLKEEFAKEQAAYPAAVKKALAEGKKPKFELEAVDTKGQAVKAAQFAGKPVLVVVLRPGHPAVGDELAAIKKAAEAAKGKGVTVLGAVYNYAYDARLTKEAAQFVENAKLAFPCVLVDRAWMKKYGILNLPAHLVVTKGGDVGYIENGWQPEWKVLKLVEAAGE